MTEEVGERTWREWEYSHRLRYMENGKLHFAIKMWFQKRKMSRDLWALASALAAVDANLAGKIFAPPAQKKESRSWKGCV